MREIEFRAWNYKSFEMYFVGDEYRTNHPLDCCVYFMQDQPVILEQYTGLKDKNGVKIFEGDILKNASTQVKFEDGCFYVCIDYDQTIVALSDWMNAEVIGNIHQDANLLTEGE